MTRMTADVSVDVAEKAADFQATLNFTSSPGRLFAALTTPAELSRWWVQAAGSGLTGGELTFDFGSGPLLIQVDEATPFQTVRWTTLLCDPAPDWVGTTIHFGLVPNEQGGTRLHFTHAGLTPQLECYDMCSVGWSEALGKLANYVD